MLVFFLWNVFHFLCMFQSCQAFADQKSKLFWSLVFGNVPVGHSHRIAHPHEIGQWFKPIYKQYYSAAHATYRK